MHAAPCRNERYHVTRLLSLQGRPKRAKIDNQMSVAFLRMRHLPRCAEKRKKKENHKNLAPTRATWSHPVRNREGFSATSKAPAAARACVVPPSATAYTEGVSHHQHCGAIRLLALTHAAHHAPTVDTLLGSWPWRCACPSAPARYASRSSAIDLAPHNPDRTFFRAKSGLPFRAARARFTFFLLGDAGIISTRLR